MACVGIEVSYCRCLPGSLERTRSRLAMWSLPRASASLGRFRPGSHASRPAAIIDGACCPAGVGCRVRDWLWLHFWEEAAAAGVGACGGAGSACLVVEAAGLLCPAGVAEDARGDAFPAELALIAERGDAAGAGGGGCELGLPSCFLLHGREPVHALGPRHPGGDLVGREACPEVRADPLADHLGARGIDSRAGWRAEAPGDLDDGPRVGEGAGRAEWPAPFPLGFVPGSCEGRGG